MDGSRQLSIGKHTLLVLTAKAPQVFLQGGMTRVWIEAEVVESSEKDLIGRRVAGFVFGRGMCFAPVAPGSRGRVETYVVRLRNGKEILMTRVVKE